jgi:hypothetical protein
MGVLAFSTTPATTQQQNSVRDSIGTCNAEFADTSLGPDSTDTQELTTFVDEACEAAELLGKHYVATFRGNRNMHESDIKAYMGRPYQADTQRQAPVAGSIIVALQITPGYLQNPFFKFCPYAFGARFTLRFRLQIAASPFSGGVYKMIWVPYNTPAPVAQTQNWMSKMPGVYVDMNEATMGVLDVPWLSAYDFWSCYDTGTVNYGTFYLVAFTSISNPASNTQPLTTIYLSLHDVEIVGAAAPTSLVVPQAGGEGVEVDRPISTMLKCAGTLSRMAGRNIPLISSFTAPVAWWSSYAAKIASSYGWSKPLFTSPTQRMIITTNALHQNTDTADTSASLALTMGNELEVMSGFAGSDVDEMSISYIVQQYSSIARFTLNTTDSIGLPKYGARCAPGSLWFFNNAPYNTYNIFDASSTIAQKYAADVSYLCYFANIFSCSRVILFSSSFLIRRSFILGV